MITFKEDKAGYSSAGRIYRAEDDGELVGSVRLSSVLTGIRLSDIIVKSGYEDFLRRAALHAAIRLCPNGFIHADTADFAEFGLHERADGTYSAHTSEITFGHCGCGHC